MKEAKLINENRLEFNDASESDEQENNLTIWTVSGMLIIWIYVIAMSLF